MVTTKVPALFLFIKRPHKGTVVTQIFFNMYCRNCGKEIAENAAVCIHCGVKAGDGNKFCSNCGAQPDPLAIVCVNCGCSLKTNRKSANEKQTEVVNSFGGAISSCFKKYATFSGRANRSEYWFFCLFTCLLNLLLGWLFIPALITLLPSLAVGVRRLHDTGKSGWWLCISFLPFIGAIWLIVLLCQPSQEEDNEYGANPN